MSEHAGESDYTYDLVHEEVAASAPRPPEVARTAPEDEVRPDLDVGDLSYDLAHEVPPAERRDG